MSSKAKQENDYESPAATSNEIVTRPRKVRRQAKCVNTSDRKETDFAEVSRILQLPEMVLLHVFSFLPVEDKCRSSRVCKLFRRLMKDPQLWKSVDLIPCTIRLQALTVFTRRYLSKSLLELSLKGLLWTTAKTSLLSNSFLSELRERCPNLRKFVVLNANLQDIMSSLFPKNVEVLRINYCQVREGWFHSAVEVGNFLNIKCLNITGCGRFTNKDIASLKQMKKLEELNILGCYRLTDQALETIAKDHINLKKLLIGDSDYTNKGILMISQSLKSLRSFTLQNCEFVTGQCLNYILRMTTLEELDISYNPQFNDTHVSMLRKGLPQLKVLRVEEAFAPVQSAGDVNHDDGVQ
ncbi:F-box/LRR-repeat protein 12 [Holothuria leucospilota]|uniref:F-box/LRR-repeat protein 12 n=1 Tax=Holothuria leucospilota TaxID=206669 RepID=A0A9Q1C8U3_HOLLE|nr:F-box/LRR-repeat protein 12 [Holothuria leucospilota]